MQTFTLNNARGMEARLLDLGATLVSLRVPDRDGRPGNVVLGYERVEDYADDPFYLGAMVGRFANRIAQARFTLDGRQHHLPANNGPHHLHGGPGGFHRRLWRGENFRDGEVAGAAFSLESPDGEEGYPGLLQVRVTYSLSPADELVVECTATTDQPTPVSLAQHSYFNLAGRGDILGHRLTINADRYLPVDEGLIPTGELAPVEATPFDFRQPEPIGSRIEDDHEQLRRGAGYDHNFVLNRPGPGLVHAAHLTDPRTGRVLDVHTTLPGLQLYSGNFLDGRSAGPSGRVLARRGGVCLEAQHFPDAPNQPGFPSAILRPGQEYRAKTVFAFRVSR
jgi:aldose 1-epimerase